MSYYSMEKWIVSEDVFQLIKKILQRKVPAEALIGKNLKRAGSKKVATISEVRWVEGELEIVVEGGGIVTIH